LLVDTVAACLTTIEGTPQRDDCPAADSDCLPVEQPRPRSPNEPN
jgi:hypothetical protein